MDYEEADKNALQKYGSVAASNVPFMDLYLDQAYEYETLLHQATGMRTPQFDEVSLLFPSEYEVWKYIEDKLQYEQVKLFNVAKDNVSTRYIASKYGVKYWFLETGTPLRLELMVLKSGVSPLHHALRNEKKGQNFFVVHYSWKTHLVEEYDETLDLLNESMLFCAQHCESSYGKFSYWTDGRIDAYLKPRVNRRDVHVMKGAVKAAREIAGMQYPKGGRGA